MPKQLPPHKCPKNGCETMVPHHILACGQHWSMIPKQLRTRVVVAWKKGGGQLTEAYLKAREEAVNALNSSVT